MELAPAAVLRACSFIGSYGRASSVLSLIPEVEVELVWVVLQDVPELPVSVADTRIVEASIDLHALHVEVDLAALLDHFVNFGSEIRLEHVVLLESPIVHVLDVPVLTFEHPHELVY